MIEPRKKVYDGDIPLTLDQKYVLAGMMWSDRPLELNVVNGVFKVRVVGRERTYPWVMLDESRQSAKVREWFYEHFELLPMIQQRPVLRKRISTDNAGFYVLRKEKGDLEAIVDIIIQDNGHDPFGEPIHEDIVMIGFEREDGGSTYIVWCFNEEEFEKYRDYIRSRLSLYHPETDSFEEKKKGQRRYRYIAGNEETGDYEVFETEKEAREWCEAWLEDYRNDGEFPEDLCNGGVFWGEIKEQSVYTVCATKEQCEARGEEWDWEHPEIGDIGMEPVWRPVKYKVLQDLRPGGKLPEDCVRQMEISFDPGCSASDALYTAHDLAVTEKAWVYLRTHGIKVAVKEDTDIMKLRTDLNDMIRMNLV
jgi:hypothetical protein